MLKIHIFFMLLTASVPAFALDGQDQAALTGLLGAARAAAAAQPGIWPGYELFRQPVLLYRPGAQAVLIGHPAPPRDFKLYAVDGFPEFKVAVSTRAMPDVQSAFYADYDLAGVPVFVLRYDSEEPWERVVNTVVHERFHVFQGGLRVAGQPGAFKDTDGGAALYAEDITAENAALAGLEQWALARALLAGGDNSSAVKDFISVRRLRRQLFGRDWEDLEEGLERSEGTAEYLSAKLLGQAGLMLPGRLSLLASEAETLLAPPDAGDIAGDMLHGRLYYTGSAICRLLDRRGAGWKTRVAAGESPFAVLLSRYPVPAKERAARVAALKKDFGYEGASERLEAVLAAGRERTGRAFRDFAAWAGPRLSVRAENLPGTVTSYTSLNEYRLGADTTLYQDNPSYEFANASVKLLVTKATLREYAETSGGYAFEVLLPEEVKVYSSGKLVEPGEQPAEFADVSVEGPQVSLKAPRALVRKSGLVVAIDAK